MAHIILGTAGHVDHGKTALVRRLTGVDTDRLREEKERGVTTVLGFAPLTLPGGTCLGIVDVPGHEKFVRTMLSGATGIDAALFVIAGNEGVMPQTREHMDILRLLGITRGVVAVTKADLLSPEALSAALSALRPFLEDSPLRGAPVCPVSAVTGAGVPALLSALERVCAAVPERSAAGAPRLAIDRAFHISGAGTVVTGTLWQGVLHPGDRLSLFPGDRPVRLRSLQAYGEGREAVFAGERAAANLPGVDTSAVPRGSWLAQPGLLSPCRRADLLLELLPGAPALSQHARVHVHHGSGAALARVRLWEGACLSPGSRTLAQLELERPLFPLPGDRVILRSYSPAVTIGGGTIINIAGQKPRAARRPAYLQRLRDLASGDSARVLPAAMSADLSPWDAARAAAYLRCPPAEAGALLTRLMGEGAVWAVEENRYLSGERCRALADTLRQKVEESLRREPLRSGVSAAEALAAAAPGLGDVSPAFLQSLAAAAGLALQDGILVPPGHTPALPSRLEAVRQEAAAALSEAGLRPLQWDGIPCVRRLPPAARRALLDQMCRAGEAVPLPRGGVLSPRALEEVRSRLEGRFPQRDFTLSQARDSLGVSRDTALTLLELLEDQGFLLRRGHLRRLAKPKRL